MMTIVTEFGKFRYNRAPRGMCALGDIFQAKADDLLDDIEGVKTYIDDILVLRKEILFKHIISQRATKLSENRINKSVTTVSIWYSYIYDP